MSEFNLKIPEKLAQERNRRTAIVTTITLHIAVLLVMVFTQCASPTKPPEELTEIQWGGSGGSPNVNAPVGQAMRGTPVPEPKPVQTPTQKPQTVPTTQLKPDPQKVQVPTTTNTPSRETVPSTTNEKPTKPNTSATTDNKPSTTNSSSANTTQGGQREDGTGTKPAGGSGGNTSGYSVAGLGTRGWITSPKANYPDEDVGGIVVLRFTVMPDGSVTNIQPVRRAAASLVNAATAGLRKARARALPASAPQVPQQGTITYTFQLN